MNNNILAEHLSLSKIVQAAARSFATDVHIKPGAPVRFRIGGILKPIQIDGIPDVLPPEFFKELLDTMDMNEDSVGFKMYRNALDSECPYQCRATYFPNSFKNSLWLRVQPLFPANFADCFNGFSALNAITRAKGLILVVGSIGSGKTTVAAGIAELWAKANRHVMTLEDPIEYQISVPDDMGGSVTQVPCSLDPAITEKNSDIFSFNEAVALALRSDIQGMYIGECRKPETLKCALEFASAQEPVVTTLHTGGVAEAITKVITMSSPILGEAVARTTLAQVLHSVLHVRMGYTSEGKPCPMVSCFPFWKDERLKQLISDFDPVGIEQKIRDNFDTGRDDEGFVTPSMALDRATDRGAERFKDY